MRLFSVESESSSFVIASKYVVADSLEAVAKVFPSAKSIKNIDEVEILEAKK